MSEPERTSEFVKGRVSEGWRRTQALRDRLKSDRPPDGDGTSEEQSKETESDLELFEPERATSEEQQEERASFENRVLGYASEGASRCRIRLIARIFELAGQEEHSRNERPLLEQAFKGLGGRSDDRIGDEDLAYLIMSRMLADVQERTEMMIARATQLEREQLIVAIEQDLDAMDPAKRDRIRQSLGVDQLTPHLLLTSALSAGVAGVFALGVHASGFAVYMALTTVIHAVATTLLGVTLPFGAYTFATTFLSTASGGLLLIPLAGSWILFHHRSRIRENRAKLGFAVASIISSTCENNPATPTWLA